MCSLGWWKTSMLFHGSFNYLDVLLLVRPLQSAELHGHCITWEIWIHTVYQSFYPSFIPSNPNTPLFLVDSSPPLTPPAGPSNTADSRQPMPSRTSPSSSPSSFPILSLNLVILRSDLCLELTRKSSNLAVGWYSPTVIVLWLLFPCHFLNRLTCDVTG